jgi:hypothetical protein
MLGMYLALFGDHRQGEAQARRNNAFWACRDFGLHRTANEYRLTDRTGRGPAAGELR